MSLSGRRAEGALRADGLLGRDHELRILRGLVDDQRGVAVIHGAAGLGKSALLAATAAYGRERDFAVHSTAGVPSEVSLPFAALERLLHGLLDRTGPLPAPQRDALLSAFGLEDSSVSNTFLVGLATLNLLSDAAAAGGLILIVDDTQWLDPSSADALGFVARRIEAEPIVLIVAQGDGGSPHAFEAAIREVAVELELTPLGDEAARGVLARTAAPLTAPARQRLLAVAAGNPLALVELPLTAADRASDALDGSELPLTQRLEQSFTAQAAGLAPAVRALLRVAAADDRDSAAEILVATRILAPDAGDPELETAIRAGLLDYRDGRLRFRHPLIQSAIYQAATSADRRAAHAAIAQASGDEPHRGAWHRAAATAGPDDLVAAELDAAAMEARRRGAPALAARELERAAALTTERELAVPRMLTAAELNLELGDLDAVARLLAGAEEFDLELGSRARARLIREALGHDGAQEETPIRALIADAEQARVGGDVDLAFKLLLAAATRCWWALPADAPAREEVVAEALRTSTEEDDARLLAVLAATSAVRHAGLIIARLERACAAPDLDPDEAHLLGQAAHMVGHSELAVRELSRVEAAWRAQGRLASLAQALIMRAWSSIQLGNWPSVAPAAEEGERLAHETAQPLWAAGALAARAAAAGVRGEPELGMTLAAEVEAELMAARPTNILAVLQVARGVTSLGAGRYAEAYDHLARLFDPTDLAHHYAERHGGLGYLAEAAVQCDRLEEARAIVSDFAPLAQGSPAMLLQIGMNVARPLVTREADHPEAAFEAALAAPTGSLPFHRARLLLAYGGWLRRSRRPADSRAPLRTARDLFDALGTVPWAERARRELRASGETSRRRVPEARDQLTPQELQIAQMAAGGLSNPEIGERLFLSARTVASHLYRAFPKLGVTSRRELASALGQSGGPN